MNKNEALFTIGITLICYVLCVVFTSRIPISILDSILVSFYVLLAIGKLPKAFYYKTEKPSSKTEITLIWCGVFFLICCFMASIFPRYIKYFGRVGIVAVLVIACVVMLSTYMKRIFGELPKDVFLNNHLYYLRLIMIVLTNFYILIFSTYSYGASYNSNGRLISKTITDGLNNYKTEYVDSLSCYVTHATIDDTGDKNINYLEYNIYYKKYPDVIEKIDTIKIVKREKKNHEKE